MAGDRERKMQAEKRWREKTGCRKDKKLKRKNVNQQEHRDLKRRIKEKGKEKVK